MIDQRGSTLLELCIVTAIFALAVSSGIPFLRLLLDAESDRKSEQELSLAKEALIGYALSHPLASGRGAYLPCPAKSPGGSEGPRHESGQCVDAEGYLPAATLGLQAISHHPVMYRPDRAFADALKGITLGMQGNLQICTSYDCSTRSGENIGAVVYILDPRTDPAGRDGAANRDGLGSDGISAQACKSYTDSVATAPCIYVSHIPSEEGATNGQFRDRMAWVSSAILMSRLVSAQRLP